jgi:hypothetical protein
MRKSSLNVKSFSNEWDPCSFTLQRQIFDRIQPSRNGSWCACRS